MAFPWKSFMGGREQDKETRKFLDSLSTVSTGALAGVPDAITIDTTRKILTNWTDSKESGTFSGKVDRANGEITIPRDGIYIVEGNIPGLVNSTAGQLQDALVFIRSSTRGDRTVSGLQIPATRPSRIVSNFNILDSYSEDEVLSVAFDATAAIGDFTPFDASFSVHEVLFGDIGLVIPTGAPQDGNPYLLLNGQWVQLALFLALFFPDCPDDGQLYVRRHGEWVLFEDAEEEVD